MRASSSLPRSPQQIGDTSLFWLCKKLQSVDMDEVDSAAIVDHQEPLVSSVGQVKKKKKLFSVLVKWVLKISLWTVTISWLLLMFMLPLEWFHLKYEDWTEAAAGTVFGITGRVLLVYSLPIVIVGFLAITYVLHSESQGEEEKLQLLKKCREKPRLRLWTFPIMVDGLLGVVSAAEVFGILVFLLFLILSLVLYNLRNIPQDSGRALSFICYTTGICLGAIGSSILAFLFLPISRGSAFLRLANIPFEHATKYHIWLGNLTMLIFTLHGISMILSYTSEGEFKDIISWEGYGPCNLAGVIALLIGLVMWITSIHPIRRKYFESFYYTHQLYILFVIFFALHVSEWYFGLVAGGLFIFMLDRFLRLCQSGRIVDVVSAKYFPYGVIELALSKPPNLRYNALSFIFLRIREVSWLQWHPFSISSSPLDGKDHLCVMIKVQGGWTTKLKDHLCVETQGYKLTASVEGPYGYELPYYITYKNLVLVAGGIGISPFLAILSDIAHRIREEKPCLARNILLVWAIKNSSELPLLSTFSMDSNKLNLHILVYVTQQSQPPLVYLHYTSSSSPSSSPSSSVHSILFGEHFKMQEEGNNSNSDTTTRAYVSNGNGHSTICNLVGTANSKWLALYLLSSTIGFVIIRALLDVYYVYALDVRPWWYKDLLLLASMVAAVVFFGGLVLAFWRLREPKHVDSDDRAVEEEEVLCHGNADSLRDQTNIHYGSRPDFRDILESLDEKWGHVDVGVIVCGPSSLETSVARECKILNQQRKCLQPIFHFHSHSFSL